MNRFKHLAQDYIKEDYIKDNKDLLTLPDNAGEEPNIIVNNTPGTDEEGTFPNIEWNFFQSKVDPNSFDDDVKSLIEHLAELQVPIAVLDKAKELIYQNQESQDQNQEEEADQEIDQEEAVSDDLNQNNDQDQVTPSKELQSNPV